MAAGAAPCPVRSRNWLSIVDRATHGIWGGDVSPHQGLYVVFFFASFLSITLKALTSPAGSGPAIGTPPPASAGDVSRAAPPQLVLNVVANRKAFIPSSAALTLLRLTIVAVPFGPVGPLAVVERFFRSRDRRMGVLGVAAFPFAQRRRRSPDFHLFRHCGLHSTDQNGRCNSCISVTRITSR
jgi:hypothetical protein